MSGGPPIDHGIESAPQRVAYGDFAVAGEDRAEVGYKVTGWHIACWMEDVMRMARTFRSNANLPVSGRDIAIRIASVLLISAVIATCSSTRTRTAVDAGTDQLMDVGTDQLIDARTEQATETGKDQGPANAPFQCGSGSQVCIQNQSYCVIHGGGAGGQGGPATIPPSYACKTFPENCARTDCTCLQSSDVGCGCSQRLDGEVVADCSGV